VLTPVACMCRPHRTRGQWGIKTLRRTYTRGAYGSYLISHNCCFHCCGCCSFCSCCHCRCCLVLLFAASDAQLLSLLLCFWSFRCCSLMRLHWMPHLMHEGWCRCCCLCQCWLLHLMPCSAQLLVPLPLLHVLLAVLLSPIDMRAAALLSHMGHYAYRPALHTGQQQTTHITPLLPPGGHSPLPLRTHHHVYHHTTHKFGSRMPCSCCCHSCSAAAATAAVSWCAYMR
jgi:hypothetical protein